MSTLITAHIWDAKLGSPEAKGIAVALSVYAGMAGTVHLRDLDAVARLCESSRDSVDLHVRSFIESGVLVEFAGPYGPAVKFDVAVLKSLRIRLGGAS